MYFAAAPGIGSRCAVARKQADGRVLARGGDDRLRAAAGDDRERADHIQRDGVAGPVGDIGGVLADGGLGARDRRLQHGQPVGFDEPRIRGDDAPDLQPDDVARDERAAVHREFAAVADDDGLGRRRRSVLLIARCERLSR